MKTVAFILSMPNVGSWNGQWSGQGNIYARVQRLSNTWADKLLSKSSYYYNFGDGWSACVKVKHVDAKEAKELRKASRGFCGYDWMIDSIKTCGEIKV